VGGGFAGLAAVKALKNAPVQILLVDRRNHHVFQPLLYQVATAELAREDVAAPIRELVRKQQNTIVAMAEVTGVDLDRRQVLFNAPDRGETAVRYDYLVLATGVEQSYFGHDEFAPFAPGLKSLVDAQAIRSELLRAYETAETEEDPSKHRDLLTMVLVGAGPTGTELSGAIANMARVTLKTDFRRIDPRSTRVILLDNGPRILASFAEELSRKAHRRLTAMGVEIRTGAHVEPRRRQGRGGGGRANREPHRPVDGRCPALTGGTVAPGRDRSGRTGLGPARLERARTARGVRGWRYRPPRAERQTPPRGGAGGAAAGALCGQAHREPRRRPAGSAALPLLRQGEHGGHRQKLRHPRVRQTAAQRVPGLGSVGRHPPRVPPAAIEARRSAAGSGRISAGSEGHA
jgi:hypothetical protein